MSCAVETLLNCIPVISPLSIVPKAVAVAAAAFDVGGRLYRVMYILMKLFRNVTKTVRLERS